MQNDSIFSPIDYNSIPELVLLNIQIKALKIAGPGCEFDFLKLDSPVNKYPWFPAEDIDFSDHQNELVDDNERFSWLVKKTKELDRNLYWINLILTPDMERAGLAKCMMYNRRNFTKENLDDLYFGYVKHPGVLTDLIDLMIINYSSDLIYFHMPFDWYLHYFQQSADELYAECENLFTRKDFSRVVDLPEVTDFYSRVIEQWELGLKSNFPNSPFLQTHNR
jgi:hypothetical protein